MAHKEIPAHSRIFGREWVKRRHVVRRRLGRAWVATRLEHYYRVAGFYKARGHGATAGARSDDNVVGDSVGELIGKEPRTGVAENHRRFEQIAALHARTF